MIVAHNGDIIRDGNVYYINEDVDLRGKEWVMPYGSIIRFGGGLVKNGTICGNNTYLEGDVRLCCKLDGTFLNNVINASWFQTDDVSQLSQMIVSVFNLEQRIALSLDKDIRLDGMRYDVKRVLIHSNGHCITAPSCYRVKEDVAIIGVNYECVNGNEIFLDLSVCESTAPSIHIESVSFDAHYRMDRFLYASASHIEFARIKVMNSSFTHFNRYVIIFQSGLTGTISDCEFIDIGDGAKDHVCAVWLGTEGGTGRFGAQKVIIKNNVFARIKASHSDVAESREAHAILVYGHANLIQGNSISGIFAETANNDPGFDSEGIYVKGGKNKIINNHLISAVGSGPDGAITVKSTFMNNTISGNIIDHSFGTGIQCYTNQSAIENNDIISRQAALISISVVDNSGSVVKSNRITGDDSLNLKTFKAAFYVSKSRKVSIENNEIKSIPTMMVTYPNLVRIELRENYFNPGAIHYGQESYYTAPFSLHEEKCRLLFKNNQFILTGIRTSQIIESWANSRAVVTFTGNRVYLRSKEATKKEKLSFFTYFFRNCKQTAKRNVLIIDSGTSLRDYTDEVKQISNGFVLN